MTALKFIFAALAGVVAGIAAGILIITVSFKKRALKKTGAAFPKNMPKSTEIRVRAVVRKHKKAYYKSIKGVKLAKILGIKKEKPEGNKGINLFALTKDVAEAINPESPAPLLEMSEKKAFEFVRVLIADARTVLDETRISALKTTEISAFINGAATAEVFLKNRAVKTTAKTIGFITRILNFFNPFYFVKKFLTATVTGAITKTAARAIIEITAKEFTKLYFEALPE